MPIKPWKRAQTIGTREHLIETASRLIGKSGYAGTALEEVVREAGLTRGAVYHHFKDKRALFEAVIDRALRELVFALEKRAVKWAARSGGERPAEALWLFVEELSDPATHRIVSLDGPAVLGYERWSELLGERLLEPIQLVIEASGGAPEREPELVAPLARLLFGAIQEASLHTAREARDAPRIELALRLLVERLLAPAPR